MKRMVIWLSGVLGLIFIIYLTGPAPERPLYHQEMPVVPGNISALSKFISDGESIHRLKPDNEARIVWADSSKRRTRYAVVYLHGFGASPEEGDPVHIDFARKFGCNLYLARLAEHGIDTTDQMINVTADKLWKSAQEALAIGKVLGDSVIIMSTSTGGTLALMLAAAYPADVYALINMSPNIAVRHPLAFIANNHWGLNVGRMVMHGKYLLSPPKPGVDSVLKKQYWYTSYRLEAVSELQELIESSMTEKTFKKVTQPCLTLYYYKNDNEQDETVSVEAIIEMNKQLSTPAALKVLMPIPDAGDHVIGSYITSHDVKSVQKAIDEFAVEKLKMPATRTQ